MTGPLRMPDASGHEYAEDQRQQTVNPVMHSLLAGCMRACALGNTNYQHSSLPDTMSCYACQHCFTGAWLSTRLYQLHPGGLWGSG